MIIASYKAGCYGTSTLLHATSPVDFEIPEAVRRTASRSLISVIMLPDLHEWLNRIPIHDIIRSWYPYLRIRSD
jgi:hypothetical protein